MKAIFTTDYIHNAKMAKGGMTSVIRGFALIKDDKNWLTPTALKDLTLDSLSENTLLITNYNKQGNLLTSLFDCVYVPNLEMIANGKKCSACGGRGYFERTADDPAHICYTCNGRGIVDDAESAGSESMGSYTLHIESNMNPPDSIKGTYRAIALIGEKYSISDEYANGNNVAYLAGILYFDGENSINGYNYLEDSTGLTINSNASFTITVQVGFVENDEPESVAFTLNPDHMLFKDQFSKYDNSTIKFDKPSLFLTPTDRSYDDAEDAVFANKTLSILPNGSKPYNLFNVKTIVHIADENTDKCLRPELMLSYMNDMNNSAGGIDIHHIAFEYTPKYFALNEKAPSYHDDTYNATCNGMDMSRYELFTSYSWGDVKYNESAYSPRAAYCDIDARSRYENPCSRICSLHAGVNKTVMKNGSDSTYDPMLIKHITLIDSTHNDLEYATKDNTVISKDLIIDNHVCVKDTALIHSNSCSALTESPAALIGCSNVHVKGLGKVGIGIESEDILHWQITSDNPISTSTLIGRNNAKTPLYDEQGKDNTNLTLVGFDGLNEDLAYNNRVIFGSFNEFGGEDNEVIVADGYCLSKNSALINSLAKNTGRKNCNVFYTSREKEFTIIRNANTSNKIPCYAISKHTIVDQSTSKPSTYDNRVTRCYAICENGFFSPSAIGYFNEYNYANLENIHRANLLSLADLKNFETGNYAVPDKLPLNNKDLYDKIKLADNLTDNVFAVALEPKYVFEIRDVHGNVIRSETTDGEAGALATWQNTLKEKGLSLWITKTERNFVFDEIMNMLKAKYALPADFELICMNTDDHSQGITVETEKTVNNTKITTSKNIPARTATVWNYVSQGSSIGVF